MHGADHEVHISLGTECPRGQHAVAKVDTAWEDIITPDRIDAVRGPTPLEFIWRASASYVDHRNGSRWWFSEFSTPNRLC
jgi:hypothetical protein